jgi:pilus assembly protein CpaE
MSSKQLKVSVLYASGNPNPTYPKLLSSLENLEVLPEARDPETLLAQNGEVSADLVLVDLDGMGKIPDWLEPLIKRLPQSEVLVCSHSRDPDFLIRIMKLRPGGFISLPLSQEDLLAQVNRVRTEKENPSSRGQGQILAVTGTKGGIGVTSIATNLAVALAENASGEVIIADLARPFPHVGPSLDLKSPHTIKDLAASTGSLDSVFVKKLVQRHPSGLDVLLGYPNYYLEPEGFPNFQSLEKIFQSLRSAYQWICVDLGGWLDATYFQVLQNSDKIMLLTQLTVPDLQNLKQIKLLLRDLDIEDSKLKIIVNHYARDYSLGLKDVEHICHQAVFETLPHDYLPLLDAINQGVALKEVAPRSKLWRKLTGLAKDLVDERKRQTEKPAAVRPGLLQRLFI